MLICIPGFRFVILVIHVLRIDLCIGSWANLFFHFPKIIYSKLLIISIFELHIVNAYMYCGIILIRGGQCSWVTTILLVRGNGISWVTCIACIIPGYYIMIFIGNEKQVRGDVNSWARVINEIHEHWSPTNNDDSTVFS
jgi:hypothetical protein